MWIMGRHEKWLRDHGFGYMIDKQPEWMRYCPGDSATVKDCGECIFVKRCDLSLMRTVFGRIGLYE
jgi:hypothetical protein